jgi:hypothetical protein
VDEEKLKCPRKALVADQGDTPYAERGIAPYDFCGFLKNAQGSCALFFLLKICYA